MSETLPALENTVIPKTSLRIQPIDFLRGIVMILMALDHARDYFHFQAYYFNPLDLENTNSPLFLTRWITHFCAPVFVFLAGTSSFLIGIRKGKKALSYFLITRGLWLIFLEFTIINFAWFFNLKFSFIALTVIWALGIGMIILSAAIHLPFKALLALSLLIIFGHNLLDPIHMPGNDWQAVAWALLHDVRFMQIGPVLVGAVYSILPWTGIMLLGYCFGKFYQPSIKTDQRRKTLAMLGLASVLLFLVIRMANVYGDPIPWSVHSSPVSTFLSFINVTKYPPSLQYVLITLGPSLLLLAFTENIRGKISDLITALGRVPMFYYIIHLYVIHILALVAALATGFGVSDMVFNTWVTDSSNLKGYGFSLGFVYLIWILVVAGLFPLCLWYDRYKTRNKEKWWLSYF